MREHSPSDLAAQATSLRADRGLYAAAVGLAVVWWAVALAIRARDLIPVWHDQQTTFTQLVHHLATPYDTVGFVNVPWAALLLVPFGLIPLELSTLIQTILYFLCLTVLVKRIGGTRRHILLALTSFVALDATLELNVDWLIALGILLPVVWSGPFLIVKPQVALGIYAGAHLRQLVLAALVVGVVLALSVLLWGWWPPQMLASIARNSLNRPYNLAPVALMPALLSYAIGLAIGIRAVQKRDAVLGVYAWLFFVPYITLYSLLIPYAFACVRWPRVALIIHIATWVFYGGVLLLGLLL